MSQDNHSKDYLVSIMFSHYDRNNNGNLEATELNEVSTHPPRMILQLVFLVDSRCVYPLVCHLTIFPGETKLKDITYLSIN